MRAKAFSPAHITGFFKAELDGKEPNNENIMNTINYLMSDEAASSSEVIFCPDETR